MVNEVRCPDRIEQLVPSILVTALVAARRPKINADSGLFSYLDPESFGLID
jgi:hypothetical protein